jgi:CRP-like cAMP-binding protein
MKHLKKERSSVELQTIRGYCLWAAPEAMTLLRPPPLLISSRELVKFVDPKEAPMENPASDEFDAKVFLGKVGAGKTILGFHKNQHVFEQGDVADTVFFIQKGKVKLTVLSEQGKEAVVAILESGQFFGEGCMNGHALCIATTTAMEDCLITAITKPAMIAALHDQPKFSELFMAS